MSNDKLKMTPRADALRCEANECIASRYYYNRAERSRGTPSFGICHWTFDIFTGGERWLIGI